MPELPDPVAQAFVVRMRHQLYRLRAARTRSDYGGMSIEVAIIIGGLVLGAIGLVAYLGIKLDEKKSAIK
ncbi:hypothetical protein P3T27_007661 [Kitasatospora sp. MAA19]|uniref:hypothetical protein n=1 Tax=Kitasatospora sp. MAA19 TaxID=3035090 RepID=UPI002476599E|nr:hypothetical protein [Kitasatospora sp. MAA19]MDH6710910.1 hypothetical protein [Kitasatospora sp. MAA19]